MDKFFDSDNPVMKFLARLVDLAMLNVLTLVCLLPLITIGGALTAMNYVLLHLVRENETYVSTMFRKSLKENFKQGIPLGLTAFAAASVTAIDLMALRGSDSRAATLLMIIITIIALMIFVTCIYMFALQSRYENSVMGTLANAARLAAGNLPKSVLMALIWLLWTAALIYFYRAAPLIFALYGLTLPGYLCTMIYNGIFEKLESTE